MTSAGRGERPLLVVLRALKLGDLLTAVPALRALARAYPEHHRVLAAPEGLAPLVSLVGGVDEVVDTQPLAPLPERLHHADLAVNLHGRGPESSSLLAASRPRRLVAFRHPGVPATADGPVWCGDEHEVDRWCRLVGVAGATADRRDLHLEVPDVPVPAFARGATVLHPGASVPVRRWPRDRWAEVARAEVAAGRHVVVTGDRSEAELARDVADLAGLDDEAVLAGRTDLLGLAAVVAAAGRVVSGDTGVAHLATAYGTPSVVLFGPVAPSRWGPPPSPRHVALWSGRLGDPDSLDVDPGLLALTPDAVTRAIGRLS